MAPASLLQRIEICNFKAFRDFSLDLDGRHLLVFGANGSGKSSLYWALYTFLQSASKETADIEKYFDPSHSQNLLNLHEQLEISPKAGRITFVFRNTTDNSEVPLSISLTDHETAKLPLVVKGDLASDFITYRFFFGFSHFRNSESFNVWPLFEKEILPFCVSPGFPAGMFESRWRDLLNEDPNPKRLTGTPGSNAYRDFNERLKKYSDSLKKLIGEISNNAQDFYVEHFSSDDVLPITLKLDLVRPAERLKGDDHVHAPVVQFGITEGGIEVKRPQSHLNEAKMTQFALSIRFAASRINLHDSDVKLLVLDDLLVSLDMSNRMKVVELLHSNEFVDYQKIILTHEIGLFQELRRHIGTEHHGWQFAKLSGDAKASPQLNVVKTELEIAEDFLANDQLAECGNRLRKCAEQQLEGFLFAASQKNPHGAVIERGKFQSLASMISEARGLLLLQAKKEFAALLQGEYSLEEFEQLVSDESIDPTKVSAANNQEKGRIIAKLVGARANLQNSMLELLSDAARKQRNAAQLLDEVKKIKDRILNPASHAGITPLYTKEAEDAVEIIRQLRTALDSALASL